MATGNLKGLMHNWITIFRMKSTPDTYGGYTSKYERSSWNVPCRLYSITALLTLTYDGKDYAVTYRMACDKDADLRPGDHIQDEQTKDKYLVLSVLPRYGRKLISHLEAYLTGIAE